MFQLIKTGKHDNLISKILFTSYFIYQFLFVFSVSELARQVAIVYSVTTKLIIFFFLIIMFCAAYKLLRGFFSKTEIIILFIVGVICLISLYNYRVVMVTSNIFAITAFKGEDYKKIIKYYVYASAIAFVLNVILGILTPFNGNADQFRYGVKRTRYGLGFYYTTICHFYFMSIVLAYLVYKEKLKLVEYIVIFILNLIIFILGDTKAPFAYVIMILIMHFILEKFDKSPIYKLFEYFTIISYPFCFLVCYLTYIFYNPSNKFLYILNEVLTGRLRLTQNALNANVITIFGQTAPIWRTGEFYIDSSFITMLVLNGVLVTIVCLVFSTYFCYISAKTKKTALLIALLLIAIRSMYDFGFMAMQLSPFTLLFYPVFDEYLEGRGRKI